MTPDARLAAAVEVLDQVLTGAPIEKALTNWARRSRFAGSGDRAAVRDLVFDAMRKKRSCAWSGGSETGRGLLLGLLRLRGENLGAGFSGGRFGPAPVSSDEIAGFRDLTQAPEAVRFDCPDWLLPAIKKDYPSEAVSILSALRDRAPVFLRVNQSQTTRDHARETLAEDEIETRHHPLVETALEVTGNPRRVQNSKAFRDGLVELQDAAPQAAIEVLRDHLGEDVLDFCAGGGGKALAITALGARVTAHDANAGRMNEIPARARRAGVDIKVSEKVDGKFDCVLCDVPCSGTGAWRRQVEAKWRLTPKRLNELCRMQDEILVDSSQFVGEGGTLCYMTCSLLKQENRERVEYFVGRSPGWEIVAERQFTPLDGGDGFYVAILKQFS